jgi:hypothetical protein
VLRSYLGKAFSEEGRAALASKELNISKRLDPNDPTAWLYSALLNQQQNRSMKRFVTSNVRKN